MESNILKFISLKHLVVIETEISGMSKRIVEIEKLVYISRFDIESFEPTEYRKYGVEPPVNYTSVQMKSGRNFLVMQPVTDFIKSL